MPPDSTRVGRGGSLLENGDILQTEARVDKQDLPTARVDPQRWGSASNRFKLEHRFGSGPCPAGVEAWKYSSLVGMPLGGKFGSIGVSAVAEDLAGLETDSDCA